MSGDEKPRFGYGKDGRPLWSVRDRDAEAVRELLRKAGHREAGDGRGGFVVEGEDPFSVTCTDGELVAGGELARYAQALRASRWQVLGEARRRSPASSRRVAPAPASPRRCPGWRWAPRPAVAGRYTPGSAPGRHTAGRPVPTRDGPVVVDDAPQPEVSGDGHARARQVQPHPEVLQGWLDQHVRHDHHADRTRAQVPGPPSQGATGGREVAAHLGGAGRDGVVDTAGGGTSTRTHGEHHLAGAFAGRLLSVNRDCPDTRRSRTGNGGAGHERYRARSQGGNATSEQGGNATSEQGPGPSRPAAGSRSPHAEDDRSGGLHGPCGTR